MNAATDGIIDIFDMKRLEVGDMNPNVAATDPVGPASSDEAREELRALRPDVMRIAEGLSGGSFTFDGERPGDGDDDWSGFAEWVATGALAIVRAVDRVTGGDA